MASGIVIEMKHIHFGQHSRSCSIRKLNQCIRHLRMIHQTSLAIKFIREKISFFLKLLVLTISIPSRRLAFRISALFIAFLLVGLLKYDLNSENEYEDC